MGGAIDFPSYIVIELPEPVSTRIRRFRGLFDRDRASLPAEITITGSCGVGLIEKGEDIEDVIAIFDKVASERAPFDASFDKLECFKSSDTYYLSFQNPEPFIRLHEAFANSGIRFAPSAYPFTPHCTLRLHRRISDNERFDISSIKIPKRSFSLDTVALYSLPTFLTPHLLHKAHLGKTPVQ